MSNIFDNIHVKEQDGEQRTTLRWILEVYVLKMVDGWMELA
jgi:hypothetical protein